MTKSALTPSGEISVEGCGITAAFAVGTGIDVLAKSRTARCPAEAPFWSIPDDFLDGFPDFTTELKRNRASWITASALHWACADAAVALDDFPPQRIALVLGNAFAGQLGMIDFAAEVREQTPRFVSPLHFPQTVGNYVAGAMSRAFTIQGPNLTIATGATSGLSAIAKACALLADDSADIAVAGGFEVLSDDIVRGLGGSTHGEDNAGVWSEGACFYVLRRAGDSVSDAPRAVIAEWSPAPIENDSDEACSLAARVGQSLAAESAMRLVARIDSSEPGQRCSVTHGNVLLVVRC